MNREPPSEVRAALQEEVGFGCPVLGCRSPFLTWHHFDPPSPGHHDLHVTIALCPEHRAAAVAGAWSIAELRAMKASKPLREEVRAKFPVASSPFLIRLGGSYCSEKDVPLAIGDRPVVSIRRDPLGMLLLSLDFRSVEGSPILTLEDNIVRTDPTGARFEAGASEIRVWSSKESDGVGLDVSFKRLSMGELSEMLAKDAQRSGLSLQPRRASQEGQIDFQSELASALQSGDFAGLAVRAWAQANAVDRDGLISVLDVHALRISDSGHRLDIENGLGVNGTQVLYRCAIGSGFAVRL